METNIVEKQDGKYSWEEIAKGLWQLLDDIDTASDMFKPKQTGFYRYVMRKAEERGKYGYSPDGYELKFNINPSPKEKAMTFSVNTLSYYRNLMRYFEKEGGKMHYMKTAEDIARKAHEGQKRNGGEPYITHPEAMVKEIMKTSCNSLIIATAWLHDVLEDTKVTAVDLLEAGIPFDVMWSVLVLTHLKKDSYVDYIKQIKRDDGAVVVKRYDIQHNLSTTPARNNTMRAKYELALYILGEE